VAKDITFKSLGTRVSRKGVLLNKVAILVVFQWLFKNYGVHTICRPFIFGVREKLETLYRGSNNVRHQWLGFGKVGREVHFFPS
jgi:hypothetical protein